MCALYKGANVLAVDTTLPYSGPGIVGTTCGTKAGALAEGHVEAGALGGGNTLAAAV